MGNGLSLFGGWDGDGDMLVPVAVGVVRLVSVVSVVGLRLVIIRVAGGPGGLGVVRAWITCGKAATEG
jgi:hypothetical protein